MCTTGVSPHTPLSSPPPHAGYNLYYCSVLFCLFWGYSFVSLTWLHTIVHILYNSAGLHCCSTHPPLWWWIDKKPAATVAWLTTYRCLYSQAAAVHYIYDAYACIYKERREGGGHYNELVVLYPLMMTACGDTRDWISLADNHQPSDEASTLSHLLENYFKKDGARTFLICYSVWNAYSVCEVLLLL